MDTANREAILQEHRGLVHHFARRYKAAGEKCGLEYGDLVGAGWLGLCRAYDRFDSNRGLKFSTFATAYIRGHIRHELRDCNGLIRLPAWQYEANQDLPVVLPLERVAEPRNARTFENEIVAIEQAKSLLDRLYGPYRLVVWGLWFEGISRRELGRRLGKSATWVQNMEQRAFKAMREMLAT